VSSLRKVREGWQEAVYSNLSEKWKPAFAIMALTGCRPAELNDLEIHPTEQEGVFRFRIEGRKVTEFAGQPWRELTIDVRGAAYGQALMAEIGNEPGKLEIKETAQAITKAVTRAAQRAKLIRLDQTLPAYVCRNAVASSLKAAGWPVTEIAAALGHSSDECQKFYGRANSGHKGGVGKVLDVKTARPVRETGRVLSFQSKP
jgi:integrase